MRTKSFSFILGVLVLGALMAGGCYESGDYPDDFKVISCHPSNQQTNVPLNSPIVLRFSNAVDHKTVQGTKQIILVDNTNSVIPTSFTYQGEVVQINPLSPLATGMTYGIAVRPGVRDIFGANISIPFSATFSTGGQVLSIPNFPPFTIPVPPGPPTTGTPGTFTQTGPLVFARAMHRMTMLLDGRVLCTGGGNDGPLGRVLRQAELFDPSTYQWSISMSLGNGVNGMNFERYAHTSTLLADGRVLIAGGTDNHKVLNIAEIYNPKVDTFSVVAGRMQHTRAFHTAERLGNGNVVLIAGWANVTMPNAASQMGFGAGPSYLLDSLEVYDIYAGTFTLTTASLIPRTQVNPNRQQWWTNPASATSAGRMHHTSSSLPDGAIMICGGYGEPWLNQALSTADAQIYYPSASGSGAGGIMKHAGSNLTAPRVCHTATVFPRGDTGGLVIIAGGFQNNPYMGVLSSCEVFDDREIATSGQFQGDPGCFSVLAQQLSISRHNHTANVVLGGKDSGGILFTGGAQHLGVMNWNPPTPFARLYPWLEPTGCGACALTDTSDMLNPFGLGKALTNPYRGLNITATIAPTQDPAGNTTNLNAIYPAGVYFHASVEYQNGVVLITGGAWCPFCMMGPNAWSTYFPPGGIVNGLRVNGPSCIYNP